MSRKAKTGGAFVLAAMMMLTGLSMKQTYAATAVDMDETCKITVSVAVGEDNVNLEGDSEYLKDFKEMSIPVVLYRVADVDTTGQNYTVLDPFKDAVDLSDISSKTEASEWRAKGEAAAKAENLDLAEHLEKKTKDGEAVFESPEISPGMYLVMPRPTFNKEYTVKYTFSPYLTALPSSDYTLSLTGTGSDEWNYTPTIGLKPQAEPQFGRLNIKKQIEAYNTTLGAVSCVFRAEGRNEQGEVVYNEVISTTHKDTAEVTATFEHIPAGIEVTVTEEYSGASYNPSDEGNRVQTVPFIWSDAAVEEGIADADGNTVTTSELSFKNQYNGGDRGGYGVTNVFEDQGAGWVWTSEPVNPNHPSED